MRGRRGEGLVYRLEFCQPSIMEGKRGKGVVNVFKGVIIMVNCLDKSELGKKVNENGSGIKTIEKCLKLVDYTCQYGQQLVDI